MDINIDEPSKWLDRELIGVLLRDCCCTCVVLSGVGGGANSLPRVGRAVICNRKSAV